EEQVDHRLAAQQRYFLDGAVADFNKTGGGIENVFEKGTGAVLYREKVFQFAVFGELKAGGWRRGNHVSSSSSAAADGTRRRSAGDSCNFRTQGCGSA